MVLTMHEVQCHVLNRYSTKTFKAVKKYDKGQELRGKILKKKNFSLSLSREKLQIDFPTSYKKKDRGRVLRITHFLKMSSEDFSGSPVLKTMHC